MRRCWSLGLCAVCCFALPPLLPAAETAGAVPSWTHWRGPSGQGYSDDARVPLTWSDSENLLWKSKLPGVGNSSPIVWGDRIFLTSSSGGSDERLVFCVRASDGKLLWQQTASKGVPESKTHEWNGYASPSCVTDGTYVYAFFGSPGLFCYDFAGKLIWKHSFGMFTTDAGWGTGASPFLFEDLVIQNCDNDGPAGLPPGGKPQEAAPMAFVALDKRTGKVRWQTERNQGKGWSTPVLVPMPNGRIDLVLNGPFGVWAYDPRTGKEQWHCERQRGNEQAKFGEPLPVFNATMLVAGSGRPGPLQAIKLGGDGNISKSAVAWEVIRKGSRDVSSPLLWQDVVYAADRYGMLSAHELKTGRVLFKERCGPKPFSASPVLVQGRILYLMEDGLALVIEPGRDLKIAHRNKLTDSSEFRASPAIVAGRMYLRSQDHLYCIGAK